MWTILLHPPPLDMRMSLSSLMEFYFSVSDNFSDTAELKIFLQVEHGEGCSDICQLGSSPDRATQAAWPR